MEVVVFAILVETNFGSKMTKMDHATPLTRVDSVLTLHQPCAKHLGLAAKHKCVARLGI